MSAPEKAHGAGPGLKGPGSILTSEKILTAPAAGAVERTKERGRVIQQAPNAGTFKGKNGKS